MSEKIENFIVLILMVVFVALEIFILQMPLDDNSKVIEISEEYVCRQAETTSYKTIEDAVKADAYEYYARQDQKQQETVTQQEITTAEVEAAQAETVGLSLEFTTDISNSNCAGAISKEEMDLLLKCVEAEAGNQSLEGRQLVADVILNRVRDDKWPDTITEVIKKPYEFESYWNGAMDRVTVSYLTRKAVELELEEIGHPGLFYFTAGRYNKWGTPWKQVGDHYFSTK